MVERPCSIRVGLPTSTLCVYTWTQNFANLGAPTARIRHYLYYIDIDMYLYIYIYIMYSIYNIIYIHTYISKTIYTHTHGVLFVRAPQTTLPCCARVWGEHVKAELNSSF